MQGENAMNDEPAAPQNEDVLVETILDGDEEAVSRLVKRHPSFSEFAREVRSVTEGLKAIEEEPPPPLPIEKIMKSTNRPFSWLQDLPLEWYKNPFVLSFGFIVAIIFFYFCLIFVVKL
jgi:hypothetical protein